MRNGRRTRESSLMRIVNRFLQKSGVEGQVLIDPETTCGDLLEDLYGQGLPIHTLNSSLATSKST